MTKPRVGDAFRLCIDPSRVGFGQIVGTYGKNAFYLIIYEQSYDERHTPSIEEIVAGEIAFLALSLDALFAEGRWEIIGHVDPPPLNWPVYSESRAPGEFVAVDHTGKLLRSISTAEAANLPNRTVVAPIRLQRAFEALHGVSEWHPAYHRLRYASD